jgi:glycine/D-amino acid oxidase-like deaminating enzyme
MRIVIIGAGVVGATIAYELTTIPGLNITVIDRQPTPVLADQTHNFSATGAALGLLMATISTKTKGRNLAMRWTGLDWYDRHIPEIVALTGQAIPVNHQGLLMLQFAPVTLDSSPSDPWAKWQNLVTHRQTQNRRLELWDVAALGDRLPQLNMQDVIGGIYSPDDRQINPVELTQGLIAAATKKGVTFQFGTAMQAVNSVDGQVRQVITSDRGAIDCDYLIIAAGVSSFALTQTLQQPVEIRPVLGQAIHLRLPKPLGNSDFQPVVTGNDIHLVPQPCLRTSASSAADYWLGATVEFPPDAAPAIVKADPERLDVIWQTAVDRYPALKQATIVRQWQGVRPRPEGRSAPVIDELPGYHNVLLTTGHYRNGVLLAPATALAVRDRLANYGMRD